MRINFDDQIVDMFQFLIGSVKRVKKNEKLIQALEFQFLIGSVKRKVMSLAFGGVDWSFNSL